MPSFNRITLMGNLTRDPELRFTNNGVPVVNFGLAVNRVRSKNEEVDFFDVSAWREIGETIANYKRKGDPVFIEGRFEQQRWQDKQDGSNRSKHVVVVENVQFLPGNNQGEGNGGAEGNAGAGVGASAGASTSADFDEDEIGDDIPF